MSHALLIVEDETILAKNIRIYFERAGYDVRAALSAEEGLRQLDLFKPDVVLLDYQLPDMDGLGMLTALRKIDPMLKVVMLTGQGSVDLAVKAMKLGAADFLTKPVELEKLRLLIEKLFSEERTAHALSYYRDRESRDSGIRQLIGESAPMQELKHTVDRLLAAERALGDDEPPAVLITGETGTGKEVLARSLHYDGPRAAGPFIELNCGTIPAHLLESELFGHERGAFTDAKGKKIGLVEAADGGTLFLDEIGDMSLDLQVKLLKLLEDKTVRPIGSVRGRKVNVRIIAATHQPLRQLITEGRFRSDLYFRLRIVQLALSPLRERGSDILLLARHFLAQQARRYGKGELRFSAEAEKALLKHHWPGNVRELRNLVEQTVLLASEPEIQASQMAFHGLQDVASVTAAQPSQPSSSSPSAPGLKLDEAEHHLILQALETAAWNVTKAAQLLGISRDTLRYRMEKHGLVRES
jgi:two-component system, NtrC family, response regulator AtoC